MAKIVAFREDAPKSDFKVEKGIPLVRNRRSFRYPFGEMKVGDSFLLGDNLVIVNRARAAASYYGRRNKMQFSILRIEGTDDHRCWRVK